MFPLPPNEAVVIAEIFRLFPDAREVGPTPDDKRDHALMRSLEAPVAVFFREPEATQASLFDPPRRAA